MHTPSQPGRSSGGVPPWEPPSPEALSAALPAYEVTGLLGRGGMGAVYRATQRSLKRAVAIKVLPRTTADDELKFTERFRHEAETLARLNHPGIVHIHDFGETADGLLYLVMEFVDGTDVHRLIQGSGRLSEDYALAVAAHVCDALAYAHARGIVHRDIKPANVLIDQEGNVKVADFGLAKMVDPQFDSGLTMSNVALGTPDYVAPEVLSYGMEADHRADLYAVGVMLYQMLTGEVPRGLFKLPSQRGLVSDTRWDEIICRALEADRDERYQSAVEVRQALDAISTGVVAVEGALAVPEPVAPTPREGGKKRLIVAGSLLFAAVAIALAVMGLLRWNLPVETAIAPRPTKPEKSRPEPPIMPDGDSPSIDWLNAPPAIVEPWAPEWNLKNGVVAVSKNDLVKQFGVIRDGSVRVRLGLTPDAGPTPHFPHGPLFQISLRSGPMAAKPGREGHYQFQVFLPNRGCSLHFLEKDIETRRQEPVEVLSEFKSLIVSELPNREVEWVFRVDGNHLSATADGVEVCSVRDDRVQEGLFSIQTDIGTKITALETIGVRPTRASPSKPSPESMPGGDSYSWTDLLQRMEWNPPWQMESGVLAASEKSQTRYLGVHRDGAVRVKLRHLPGKELSQHHPSFSLTVRGSRESGGSYQFQIVPQKRLSNLLFLPEDPDTGAAGAPHFLWEGRPLNWDGDTIDLEFVIKGKELRLSGNGKPIAEVEDSRSPSGAWGAIFSPGVEILELSLGIPLPPDSALPGFSWTDVSATLREMASADPKLVVEEGGIRRAGDGSPVAIPVTDPAWRNYALRVRHSNDTQINLRSSPALGFLYVLCQGSQTLFHRWDIPKSENVILQSAVPHPPGFDITAPHELVAAVEDNLVSVWIDGRLVGRVRDSALTEGVGSVMWVRQSVVHSVEVAPLPDPAHPKLGESFWGQVGSVNAGRKIEIVEAKLEEINRADVTLEPTIEGGRVTALKIFSKDGRPVPDLSPVAALSDLKILFSYVPGVEDLAWLRGLPVNHLQLERGAFAGLGPIRESRIKWLDLDFPVKAPADYSVLAGMPLQSLSLQDCPVGDLSFVSGMPLDRLLLKGTGIADYAALQSLPLVEVDLDLVPGRDLPILLSIPTLKKINGKPVEEYRQPAAAAGDSSPWTDWLGPRLADPNQFQGGGWIREDGGITTDQPLKGTHTFPVRIRDGAVRVTFGIRDSEGVILDARQTLEGPGHHRYAAQYTGKNLYIAHSPPDATRTVRLVNQPIPEEVRSRPEHTLEFRFVGEELTAVLDDEIRISARHSQLQEGLGAIVLTKGVLVKKVETQTLSFPAEKEESPWRKGFGGPSDWEADAVAVGGWLRPKSKRTIFLTPVTTSGAIRARMKFVGGEGSGGLTIRSNDGKKWGEESFACSAFLVGGGTQALLLVAERGEDGGAKPPVRYPCSLPAPVPVGGIVNMELACEDGVIRLRIDDREMASIPDPAAGVERRFGLIPSDEPYGEFSEVMWRP